MELPSDLKRYEETTPRTLYRVIGNDKFKYSNDTLIGYGYKDDPPDYKWMNHYGKATAYTASDLRGAHFFAAEMNNKMKTVDKGYKVLTLKTNGMPYVDIFKHKDNEDFRRAVAKNADTGNPNRQHIKGVVNSYMDNLASYNKEVIIFAPNLDENRKEDTKIVKTVTYKKPNHVGEFTGNLEKAKKSLAKWNDVKKNPSPQIPPPAVDRKRNPKPDAPPPPIIYRKRPEPPRPKSDKPSTRKSRKENEK